MTQIQEKSIPAILNFKDCFLKSQTGSGKTLAYAIPIVERLQSYLPKLKRTDGIRALILVPTRELGNNIFRLILLINIYNFLFFNNQLFKHVKYIKN